MGGTPWSSLSQLVALATYWLSNLSIRASGPSTGTATLASRVRVLGSGHSNKNDSNDARSVAIAALRSPTLRSVRPADHTEVLRLLAKSNLDLGRLEMLRRAGSTPSWPHLLGRNL